MPYKHNDSKRHKFDKPKYKVTNASAYNESLRQRGDITFWFSDEALASWKPERMQGGSTTIVDAKTTLTQFFQRI